MHTPDSPGESMMSELNSDIMSSEQFSNYVKEKLNADLNDNEDIQSINTTMDDDNENIPNDSNNNINIGTFNDEDVPIKYCARLLASRFLLSGSSGWYCIF
jgi:hypothetical protein